MRSWPARRASWRCALALSALMAAWSAGCATLWKEYEYEEDATVSLDGSVTIFVNASLAALAALRDIDLDLRPNARFDAGKIRAAFSSPTSRVGRVSAYRRHGRRYVTVRVDAPDIRRLASTQPFAWSSYTLERRGGEVIYRHTVGAATNRDVGNVGWSGRELVAFRVHLPSRIIYHNAPSKAVERGNILTWEQALADRRAGAPLAMEVRMEATSILYHTLWLFGISALAALAVLGAIVWWVWRKR